MEEDQKLVRDLTQKPVESFKPITETPKSEKEEKIVFELIEDEIETPAVATINDNELIAMNQFIKNLDVTFEIVSPIKDIDYKFTTPEVAAIKVVEAETIATEDDQITFSFDMPIAKTEEVDENRIVFDLSDTTLDIEVNEVVQFVPMTELNEEGVIKYSLEEYMELENDLLNSKPVAKVVEEPVAEELNITLKAVEPSKPINFSNTFEDVSPIEMTIEETLKHRADDRRKKLKEFNYQFLKTILSWYY